MLKKIVEFLALRCLWDRRKQDEKNRPPHRGSAHPTICGPGCGCTRRDSPVPGPTDDMVVLASAPQPESRGWCTRDSGRRPRKPGTAPDTQPTAASAERLPDRGPGAARTQNCAAVGAAWAP